MKKNKKIAITLILCLLFQILVPLIIRQNESHILNKGTLYRFNVSTIKNDYDNGVLQLEIETVDRWQGTEEEEKLKLKNYSSVKEVYQIFTNANEKSYLNKVSGVFLGGNDYLNENVLTFKVHDLPSIYFKNDSIKDLHYGINNNGEYITLEAEVYILYNAYIVTGVYINEETYHDYIFKNYYELLE